MQLSKLTTLNEIGWIRTNAGNPIDLQSIALTTQPLPLIIRFYYKLTILNIFFFNTSVIYTKPLVLYRYINNLLNIYLKKINI